MRGRPKLDLGERFWAKVDKTDTCWLWTGAKNSNGYGQIKVDGKVVPAHRVAYELTTGPIPEGLTIDHLCMVRNCVNPAHLEAVTMRVNVLRGNTITGWHARQTHCKNGHPFSDANWDGRQRRCPACRREQAAQRRQRAVTLQDEGGVRVGPSF